MSRRTLTARGETAPDSGRILAKAGRTIAEAGPEPAGP